MSFKILKIIFISLTFFLFTSSVQAANSLDVVINEIAWMGTEASHNDEWIELYNNTNLPVNLNGWSLKATDDTPEISLNETIPAHNFYLLERTDDNAVPNTTADLIYAGALSNKGEYLQLFDGQNNLIDEVNSSDGWFAGDNKTKQTMERKDPLLSSSLPNWQTSKDPNGTPKFQNSTILVDIGSPPAESGTPEKKTEPITYPSGIVFNEILPSPEGPDAENEWIEIFNQNNFEVDLSSWKIIDTIGRTKTYVLSKGVKISTQGFLVLSRPETKITLNNDGDGLNLLQPNGKIIDTITYEKAPRNESYNLTKSGWIWSNVLTPSSENILPESEEIVSNEKQLEVKKELKTESPETKKTEIKKELAAVSEQISEDSSGFLDVLFIALSLAIFSGIMILILKKKIKKLIFYKK